MKSDLVTSVGIGVIGLIVGYIVAGMFVSEPKSVSFKTIDSSTLSADLPKPDEGVFNYLALDPTVEVYVGSCTVTDAMGNCLSDPDYMYKYLQGESNSGFEGYYYDEDTGEMVYRGTDYDEDEYDYSYSSYDDEDEDSTSSFGGGSSRRSSLRESDR